MWSQGAIDLTRDRSFFRLALSHDTLQNMYAVNFSMVQHHKYSLTELENMIPWEREIFVILLNQHLKEEEEKRKKAQQ